MDHQDNILDFYAGSKHFLKLAVPAVAAQLINILYNLVDKMFIGHIPRWKTGTCGSWCDNTHHTAISAFAALMVSMGGAPKASIFLGKGDTVRAEKALGLYMDAFAALYF